MEVLEIGDGFKRYRCPKCDSLLKYSRKDIYIKEENKKIITYEYIKCPICNKEILVGVNKNEIQTN